MTNTTTTAILRALAIGGRLVQGVSVGFAVLVVVGVFASNPNILAAGVFFILALVALAFAGVTELAVRAAQRRVGGEGDG